MINKWQREKPQQPCLFATRTYFNSNDGYFYDRYFYELYTLEKVDNGGGEYLAIFSSDGNEWGDYNDFYAEEYFIIEYFSK